MCDVTVKVDDASVFFFFFFGGGGGGGGGGVCLPSGKLSFHRVLVEGF